ncbi:hypothetical protein [Streptomyces sp. NPDC046832]|uniref:hypothetical protein n=1 Tax=Streptomyces sp. NPDC046832 TaxID=3155020 RepID=UPI0033C229C8
MLNSPDKDKLAENLAEANTTKRVAQTEAAAGSTVYSSVGEEAKLTKLPDGLGGEPRIAGQAVSPAQLKAMDDAWNAKSDTEKYEAIHSGKMKDPKTAMQYLGVS